MTTNQQTKFYNKPARYTHLLYRDVYRLFPIGLQEVGQETESIFNDHFNKYPAGTVCEIDPLTSLLIESYIEHEYDFNQRVTLWEKYHNIENDRDPDCYWDGIMRITKLYKRDPLAKAAEDFIDFLKTNQQTTHETP